MTKQQLSEVITKHSKPELAKLPGMVRQVWEDGEVTCQKSGDLLWQRNLHQFEWPLRDNGPVELFPEKYIDHGFIFTDEEGAEAVRAALKEYFDEAKD